MLPHPEHFSPTSAAFRARRFQPTALRALIIAAASIAAAGAAPAWAQQRGTPAASNTMVQDSRDYAIPAGSLSAVLTRLSLEAGVSLAGASSQAATLASPGVQGRYRLDDALNVALAGTGTQAIRQPNGSYLLQQASSARPAGAAAAKLNAVDVTAVTSADPVTEHRRSYTTGALGTTVGLQLSPRETPQSVSVITKKQIDDLNLTSMAGVLGQTTGINVVPDSGRVRFQSRGFYIDQIEEDGISSTVPGASSNPYRSAESMTALEVYDRVEIVRGATGLTQANGEPGGTINAVRKRPTREFQAQGSLGLGSWNERRATADVSGSLNEARTLRGRVVSVATDSDSFKRSVERDSAALYGVLEADLGSASVLTVGGLLQRNRETPDLFGVPMGVGGTDLGLPRDTYLGADWSRSEFDKGNVFAELAHYFDNDWTLTAKLNAVGSTSEQVFTGLANGSNSYAGVGADGLLPLNNMQHYDSDSSTRAVQLNLNGPYQLLGRRHELFVTGMVSREESDSRWRQFMDSTPYNVWTFDPASIAEPDWNDSTLLQNDVTYNTRIYQRALSLGTRLHVAEPMHVIVGGRYSRVMMSGSNQYATWAGRPDTEYNRDDDQRKSKFVPYLGATYALTAQTSLYGSYTQIFKPQGVTDTQGKFLDPVVGTNYELGSKTELFDGRLNLAAALFQITQQNRAIYDTPSRSYFPDGKVRSRGYELEAAGELTSRWSVFAGYTFNHSKYLEGESTLYPEGANFSKHTPRHMLRLYTNYQLGGAWSKLSIGGGAQVQSATSSLYNIEQGGYVLWNANAQYQFNKNLRLNLVVNNLTDKRYYLNHKVRVAGINNLYGTPRSVFARLDWMVD